MSAGDDAKIRVWKVPEGGLEKTMTEPELILQGKKTTSLILCLVQNLPLMFKVIMRPQLITGHTEKIYSIKFHPHASGLLVSSSYDMTVRLWDLEVGNEVKKLKGHQDQVSVLLSPHCRSSAGTRSSQSTTNVKTELLLFHIV